MRRNLSNIFVVKPQPIKVGGELNAPIRELLRFIQGLQVCLTERFHNWVRMGVAVQDLRRAQKLKVLPENVLQANPDVSKAFQHLAVKQVRRLIYLRSNGYFYLSDLTKKSLVVEVERGRHGPNLPCHVDRHLQLLSKILDVSGTGHGRFCDTHSISAPGRPKLFTVPGLLPLIVHPHLLDRQPGCRYCQETGGKCLPVLRQAHCSIDRSNSQTEIQAYRQRHHIAGRLKSEKLSHRHPFAKPVISGFGSAAIMAGC